MKGSTQELVSIATALWDITAQWQADHGTQPSAAAGSHLFAPMVESEHIRQWQTQVSPRRFANPQSCWRSRLTVHGIDVACADTAGSDMQALMSKYRAVLHASTGGEGGQWHEQRSRRLAALQA